MTLSTELVERSRYQAWHGRLRPAWQGSFAIVRLAVVQLFRRKAYWFVFALGFAQFMAVWSVIYAVTQLPLPEEQRMQVFRIFGFGLIEDSAGESGYIRFMDRQSVVVMLLLTFSGNLLVGADFQHNSLPFYLSRRIDRRHYIAGKLLAVAALVALLTWIPAILLYVEYSAFAEDTSYWRDNIGIIASVLSYGMVLSAVMSVLIVSISAWLQRPAPIAIVWASIMVLSSLFAQMLSLSTRNRNFLLLDISEDMRAVGRLCFDKFRYDWQEDFAWKALYVLIAVTAVAFIALMRRVRAVDVIR